MPNRSEMPTKKDILKYWAPILIKDYSKFWLDAVYDNCSNLYTICNKCPGSNECNLVKIDKQQTDICFACGAYIGTERCHIEPYSEKQNNDLSNLHLLCKECHLESENIGSNALYFEWLSFKCPENSGSILRLNNKTKLFTNLIKAGKIDILPEYIKTIKNNL